jgi:hypothetical protein
VTVTCPPDPEQLALDAEDTRLRLNRLLAALAAQDDADGEVCRLARLLVQAKRRAKEARWNVATIRGGEDRRRPRKEAPHAP